MNLRKTPLLTKLNLVFGCDIPQDECFYQETSIYTEDKYRRIWSDLEFTAVFELRVAADPSQVTIEKRTKKITNKKFLDRLKGRTYLTVEADDDSDTD